MKYQFCIYFKDIQIKPNLIIIWNLLYTEVLLLGKPITFNDKYCFTWKKKIIRVN